MEAAEQFGTNLRATVTTSLPNLVRASIIPITSAFIYLKGVTDIFTALMTITFIVYALGFWGVYYMRETFHKDLDFIES